MKKILLSCACIGIALLCKTSYATSYKYQTIVDVKKFDIKDKNEVCKLQAETNLEADRSFGDLTKSVYEFGKVLVTDEFNFKNESQLVIINKTNKTLSYYNKDKLIGKYPVALGVKSYKTPSMKTTVKSKTVNPYWGGMNGKYKPQRGGSPNNPLGKRWISIGGMYGIHGNNNQSSIGKYASHGCIRMFNEQVEKIYDLIPIGTKVWIGTKEELERWGIKQLESVKYVQEEKEQVLKSSEKVKEKLKIENKQEEENEINRVSLTR